MISRVFASSVFPVVMTGAIAATLAMLAAGVEPALAIVPAIVGSYVLIAVLERVFPYQRGWLHSTGDLGPDIGWLFTNSMLNRLVEPVLLVAATAFGVWLSAAIGAHLWPERWPLLAQLVLALVVAEFFEYWFHRLMHEHDALWRFHSVHHSAPRLYWLNAVRFHPVDYLAVGIGKLMPLAALGAPAEVFALMNTFAAVHGAFQHANLELRLGPLNWIFSMAELHRWHHSRELEEANTNYGGNLIVWDIVFGTRFLPSDREPPADIGLSDMPAFPTDYSGQLLAPIRWRAIRESTARS